MTTSMQGKVIAVCKNSEPGIPKHPCDRISLLAGFGVEGDYHSGKQIRHRYLVKKDPSQPNHRQVLIVDEKITADIAEERIKINPGQLGENLHLTNIELMQLPVGTRFISVSA